MDLLVQQLISKDHWPSLGGKDKTVLSFFCGQSFGNWNTDWGVDSIVWCEKDGKYFYLSKTFSFHIIQDEYLMVFYLNIILILHAKFIFCSTVHSFNNNNCITVG